MVWFDIGHAFKVLMCQFLSGQTIQSRLSKTTCLNLGLVSFIWA